LFASATAAALPIPELPPVTIATFWLDVTGNSFIGISNAKRIDWFHVADVISYLSYNVTVIFYKNPGVLCNSLNVLVDIQLQRGFLNYTY